jgi:hypothetical protein
VVRAGATSSANQALTSPTLPRGTAVIVKSYSGTACG